MLNDFEYNSEENITYVNVADLNDCIEVLKDKNAQEEDGAVAVNRNNLIDILKAMKSEAEKIHFPTLADLLED